MHKICELCKKAPATVHLTDIHNNVKKELHMCEACAAQKGISIKHTASLQQVLGTLEKKVASVRKENDNEPEAHCDVCGISWSDFRQKGRFGCANDYAAFREMLEPMLEDIHGRQPHHLGKAPSGQQDETSRRRHAILECQRQLREAVELERYEDAAQLRDRLNSLKSAN